MHVTRSEFPDWLTRAIDYLAAAPDGMDAEQWAQRIHEALEIVEAKKYATAQSRFTFRMSGATEEDLAEIRRHLTLFENLIVDITTQEKE